MKHGIRLEQLNQLLGLSLRPILKKGQGNAFMRFRIRLKTLPSLFEMRFSTLLGLATGHFRHA